MQKNPQENLTIVEIDPVSGEHYVVIPEWICDENGWYEGVEVNIEVDGDSIICLLYTSPSPRDATLSRMPSSA